MLIKEIMTPKPLTIGPGKTVSEGLSLMYRYDIRRLPVLEDGRLLGILTDRDVKQWMGRPFTSSLAGEDRDLGLPIEMLMTRNPITVLEDDPVEKAIDLLVEHKISGLPVVDHDNRLVGVLSEIDILRYTQDLIDRLRETQETPRTGR
ncbi:MAG TPA: CBS domain-containing protein [Nitrospiria bacterium]|nr:CBS domain-containing protein [Nitrospiria bacterium]